MTLDEAIAIQDAAEAIDQRCSRVDYQLMHKAGSLREAAGNAYDKAKQLIDELGTARKVINLCERRIDNYREVTA